MTVRRDAAKDRSHYPQVGYVERIAVVLSYEGTPQADLDLAQNVIETLDINP